MVRIDQSLLEGICREFKLSFVVLFGSQLPGKRGLKGDYDIAVLSQNGISGSRELDLISRFSQILKTDAVDIIILNFAHPLVQYEVATTGRLLYERKAGSFDRFRWQAIQKWNDNKKFNDLKLDYIKDYIMEVKIGS